MPDQNRFQPTPESLMQRDAVASNWGMRAIAGLALLQALWVFRNTGPYLTLMNTGALSVIPLFLSIPGLLGLYGGALLSARDGRRGARAFAVGFVFLLLAVPYLRVSWLYVAGPFILGALLSACGWWLVRQHRAEDPQRVLSRLLKEDAAA